MINTYSVPKKQWAKWNGRARYTFNYVYDLMTMDQSMYLHPEDTPAPDSYWSTTAWNAAWIAAESVMDFDEPN